MEKPSAEKEARPAQKYNQLKQQLKIDEGWRSKPYHCSANKLTIGYGRNIEDIGISEEEGDFLLEKDILRCVEEAKQFEWFSGLDEVRRDVVLNMIFNLGISRFYGFRKTIAAIEKGDWEEASKEMLDSRWALQVGARANRLAQMMRSGRYA